MILLQFSVSSTYLSLSGTQNLERLDLLGFQVPSHALRIEYERFACILHASFQPGDDVRIFRSVIFLIPTEYRHFFILGIVNLESNHWKT